MLLIFDQIDSGTYPYDYPFLHITYTRNCLYTSFRVHFRFSFSLGPYSLLRNFQSITHTFRLRFLISPGLMWIPDAPGCRFTIYIPNTIFYLTPTSMHQELTLYTRTSDLRFSILALLQIFQTFNFSFWFHLPSVKITPMIQSIFLNSSANWY